MAGKEKLVETAILNWLNMLPNVFCFKNHTTGIWDSKKKIFRPLQGFSIKGVSDIIGVIAPTGTMIAIEVKSPEGLKVYNRQSTRHVQEQKAFLDTVKHYGGIAGVASSIEDAMEILKRHNAI